jgi:hypothetical protein
MHAVGRESRETIRVLGGACQTPNDQTQFHRRLPQEAHNKTWMNVRLPPSTAYAVTGPVTISSRVLGISECRFLRSVFLIDQNDGRRLEVVAFKARISITIRSRRVLMNEAQEESQRPGDPSASTRNTRDRDLVEESLDAHIASGDATEVTLRQIQDRLFELRISAPLVPEWFYKIQRTSFEKDMTEAAAALSKKAE